LSIGKYDTPPPQAHPDLLLWATQLVAWLRTEESSPEEALEDDFLFGGEGVANRLFGFEGIGTPTVPEDFEILSAPAAGKKKIVTSLTINSVEAATGTTFRLFKLITATKHYLTREISVGKTGDYVHTGYIALDDAAESLKIEVTVGTLAVHWDGSYLAVD
jgi:hypothetical protein